MSDSKPFEIRASLLHLAKDVLSQNSHMAFEANKAAGKPASWDAVTTEQVITEAEKMYSFVTKR
jgi:hypothetical protein